MKLCSNNFLLEVSKPFLGTAAAGYSCLQQMRVMVKWRLNLKLLSYHPLRTTGFMHLPSERTLRDYTHYIKAWSGFQDGIDEDLKREANIQSGRST